MREFEKMVGDPQYASFLKSCSTSRPARTTPRNLSLTIVLILSLSICGCSANASGVTDSELNQRNSFELFKAAATANSAGRTEDAAILFIVGQVRYDIDKQIFPPVGQGGDSPATLKTALTFVLGPAIGPAIKNDPAIAAAVAKRLRNWKPEFPENYQPGWEYKNRLPDAAIPVLVATATKKVLEPLERRLALAGNEEFAKLTKEHAAAQAEIKQYDSLVLGNSRQRLTPEESKAREAAIEKQATLGKQLQELTWQLDPGSRWHARVGWKAEDYFQDDRVIALCRAIEADDLPTMEQLIKDGANVNTVSKDGMTPLLWAFPERKFARFELLLKHGADPNVIIQSTFGLKGQPFHPFPSGGQFSEDRGCAAGHSVLHLAARSPQIEYLQAVMANGGDANLANPTTGQRPLHVVIDRNYHFDAMQRVELLLAAKAEVNVFDEYTGTNPVMRAVDHDLYDVALLLLRSGADPTLLSPNGKRTFSDVMKRKRGNQDWFNPSDPRIKSFAELEQWLKENPPAQKTE